ncbi:type V CRISPR-associated protein Cas12k [Kamptonema sp. UHCC 0994]|uniref:type V CRISPR-associated protein Cas12k n=1 Tax=Kamptonema sp. UHCC 0994 TaxID=3031329 RepID=UPI0023B9E2A1|nr:type V CRISPR-associated protein Cas12k [Kamptonema sp. UHCC 0994]MDF0554444.1 type V CRISPR-associated protein Cas12k [Kamptonema sp. UHCC 0994]
MSQITIQCRLIANESTRRQLWELMAQKNTPLINELLERVGQHPDFLTWRQNGKLPPGLIKQLYESLKTDPRYAGQPSRFYMSAIALVNYIYKSWFALMKRLQYQLEGKTRWLEMLKSDAELVETSGVTLETLRHQATEILTQLTAQPDSPKPKNTGKKAKKPKASESDRTQSHSLFAAYRQSEDTLTRSAIAYLLKNGCKLTDKEEDPEKFAKRRRRVEIQIQRLTEQLTARMPKGRDLTNAQWLETLAIASTTVPETEAQAKSWQDRLLKQSSAVPFPVTYETNEDLTWFKNTSNRLCVKFNGLSEHSFQIYCDQRQILWFERFLEDQQIKRASKNQHSSSLFTLRTGRIAWQEGEGKGEPWNLHRLTLYCTVDTRLWTAEGTEQVKEEKAAEIAKVLTKAKEKGNLNENQQAFIQRKSSTLTRINNPFPRPSKPLYQGQPHILVGVSLGLEKPATVAVVDAIASQALTYRSVKQLLGKNYHLLNRQRQEKQRNSQQRRSAQKQAAYNHFGESELGEYVDRLLAKEIVAIAQTYQASSIVLPKLGDMREIVQSEIQALAEQKCPEYLEGQRNYAKQYRVSIHQWSYGRLIECIKSQAAKIGIAIEEGQQPVRGSPQEKAREMAIASYQSRAKI